MRSKVLWAVGFAGLLAIGCSPQLSGVANNQGRSSALTVFSPSATPSNTNIESGFDVELGFIFFSDVQGTVNGIRFYKGTADTGAHTGHLWSSSGTLLASVTFSGETASGWQYMAFSSPVTIFAGQSYIASYHTITGFSWDPNYFTSQVNASPLHIPAAGGVYKFGPNPSFPTLVYENSNYWVDIDFTAATSSGNTTLFGPSASPATEETNTDAVELGVKFTVDVPGVVNGIRFYKTVNDTGTHTGHVWDQDGNLLGTVNFGSETASGWQEAPAAIHVATGQTYTVSYTTSASFAFDNSYFTSGIDAPPLHAPIDAGVYGAAGSYPQGNYFGDNYWVDVDFAPSGCTPSCTACGVSNGCGEICCAASAYSEWSEFDGPPNAGLTGSFDFELGTKFIPAVDGTVTHLRYYRDPNDTGSEVGHLWDPAGNLLATAPFTGGSASGWQDVVLPSPIAVAANQTYVVSYHATSAFSFSPGYFAGGRVNPPLNVPIDGGVYANGTAFPTLTYESSSYWADVVFVPAPQIANLFGPTSTPSLPELASMPFELGVQFTSDVAGTITKLRYYQVPGDTETHAGHLWDGTGTLLATVTFPAPNGSGWLEAAVSPAPSIAANTTYVASFSTTNAFSADEGFYGPGFDRPPLHVPAQGGVYNTTVATFPNQTFNATNYWVDVTFAPNGASGGSCTPTCSGVACGQSDGCGGTCCTGSSSCTTATCDTQCATLNTCGGTCTPVADGTACTTGGMAATCLAGVCTSGQQYSFFNDVGSGSDYDGAEQYELGVKFTSDISGNVVKVRFVKPQGGSGVHVGHLWDASGNLLGTASFSTETASGWQEATFPSPIPITASTTYVASYSTHGGFDFSLDYFDNALDVPPLHAPVAAGVYAAEGSFPTTVYQNSSYWVDVVVTP